MDCGDALPFVEPIAAGDQEPDARLRAHLESCPRCAGALASARRIEAALASIEVPPASPRFTAAVLQRIHRERWRSEQQVDWLFNAAIAAALVVVVASVAAMLNLDLVFSLAASAWLLAADGSRGAVRDAAPALATYLAAAGLLASALGMWWWAERRLQY